MNIKLMQHPLMRLLMSQTLAEMTDEDGNHPLMLDIVGEKELTDEEATDMINELIVQFNLDTIERIK